MTGSVVQEKCTNNYADYSTQRVGHKIKKVGKAGWEEQTLKNFGKTSIGCCNTNKQESGLIRNRILHFNTLSIFAVNH